ncbi:VP1 [Chicken proventriculitis-associated circular virus 19]|nr:VP1 [Chicken proventriculitis-associated circular virus 19]
MYGKYKRRKSYGRRRRSGSRFKFARRSKARYGRRRFNRNRFRRYRRVGRTYSRRARGRGYTAFKRSARRNGSARLTSHLQFDDVTLDLGQTFPNYGFDIDSFELQDILSVDALLTPFFTTHQYFKVKRCILKFESQHSGKVRRPYRTWTQAVSEQNAATQITEDWPTQLANTYLFTINDTKYFNFYQRYPASIGYVAPKEYQRLLKTKAAKLTPLSKVHTRKFVPRIFPTYANLAADTYTQNLYPKGAMAFPWIPTSNYTDYTNYQIRGMSWGLTSRLKNADLPSNLNAPKITITPHLYVQWEFKGLRPI